MNRSVSVIEDIDSYLISLPMEYQVFVGWNPENNTDVGWLNLKPGVKIDFQHFQLRDFNFNHQKKATKVVKADKVIAESYLDLKNNESLLTGEVHKSSNGKSEIPVKDRNFVNVQGERVENVSKYTCENFPRVENESVEVSMKHENLFHQMYSDSSSCLLQCLYCKRQVKDIVLHEEKCPSKNSKGKKVKCPQCNHEVLRSSLINHVKNHTIVRKICPDCHRIVLEEKFELDQQKCIARNRKYETIKCPICDKTVAKTRINEHLRRVHPNDIISDNIDIKKFAMADLNCHASNMSKKEEVDKSSEKLMVSAGDVSGEEVAEREPDESLPERRGLPPCDEMANMLCRLKFKMLNGGRMFKKVIKTSSENQVLKALEKFSKHLDSKFDDLEFMSHDYVLDGEELAGSIDRGLIRVSFKATEDNELDDFEMEKGRPRGLEDFEEIRGDSNRFSSSSTHNDLLCTNQEVNQDLPRVGSEASISFSEVITGDNTEDDMETDQNIEHVIDFSYF